jgi:phosphoribosylformylglycinamidine synthase PurS subunit
MHIAKIQVVLKPSVLDPQGQAVKHSVESMNIHGIEDVRIGKYIELKINEKDFAKAKTIAEDLCNKILVNPVIETYHLEIVSV